MLRIGIVYWPESISVTISEKPTPLAGIWVKTLSITSHAKNDRLVAVGPVTVITTGLPDVATPVRLNAKCALLPPFHPSSGFVKTISVW